MPGHPQHPGSGSQHPTGSSSSSSSSSQPSGTSQPGGGQGGQQAPQPQGGPPTNEQLIQYMMISKGLNRETASEELFENPDPIKQQYAQLQQLMCSGGGQQSASGQSGSGQSGPSGSSGQSSGH